MSHPASGNRGRKRPATGCRKASSRRLPGRGCEDVSSCRDEFLLPGAASYSHLGSEDRRESPLPQPVAKVRPVSGHIAEDIVGELGFDALGRVEPDVVLAVTCLIKIVQAF